MAPTGRGLRRGGRPVRRRRSGAGNGPGARFDKELVGAVQETHWSHAFDRRGRAAAPPRGLLGLEDLAVDVFEGSLTGKGALVDDLRGFALAARPLSIK